MCSTRNWNGAATGSQDTPTTATFMFAASVQANGSWPASPGSSNRRLKLRVNTAKSAVASQPNESSSASASWIGAMPGGASRRRRSLGSSSGSRTHVTDRWAQPRAGHLGAIALSHRMAWVLWLLRDSNGTASSGQMDQAAAPRHRLEAAEVRHEPLRGIASPRY